MFPEVTVNTRTDLLPALCVESPHQTRKTVHADVHSEIWLGTVNAPMAMSELWYTAGVMCISGLYLHGCSGDEPDIG